MGELEERRRQDPKYLKSLLQTRINQYKMLNNTLCEMISRNSGSKAIEMMKTDLDDIIVEMENINKDLEKLKSKGKSEEPVTYSYYDNVKKDQGKSCMGIKLSEEKKKEKGFYNSIVKQTKACEFKDAEDAKKGIRYNYDNIYENIKKYQEKNKIDEAVLTKEFVEDLRNTADSRLQSNRFLVDLKDPLNIPEIMVRSVSFDPSGKRVSVCIYDFVTDVDGKKYPILEILKYAPTSFSFSIKHLEADGKVEYVEKYIGCRVMEIFRDPIDYANDDFSKIQLFISYHEVNYETSN